MTVLDNAPRDQYTATSGQTVFPYTFEIAAAGDIKVLQNGTLLNQGAGAGEYAVSGVGVDTGGNITLVTGATSGDIITIYRDMAYERLTAYTNAGDFLAADVNNDFDRLWLALQQNGGDLDGRVLIAPNSDPTSIDMTIPAKADRIGKFLRFNDDGDPVADGGTAPANAASITYTPAGAGAVDATVQAKLRESVSVKDFGAVGDGVTDDTAAFQAAVNYAAPINLTVLVPSGVYIITTTIDCPQGTALYGASIERNALSYLKFNPAVDSNMFYIHDTNFSLSNLYIVDLTSGVRINTLFYAENDSNYEDIDMKLAASFFIGFHYGVWIRGRGLNVQDCVFSAMRTCVRIQRLASPTYGPNPDQGLEGGMRVYRVENCRFHGLGLSPIIVNNDTSKEFVNGIHFVGNYIDTPAMILQGSARNSLIASNTHLYGGTAILDIQGNFSDSVVSNNLFVGRPGGSNLSALDFYTNIITVAGTIANVVINGNMISKVTKDIFSFDSSATNVSITNNVLSEVLENNRSGSTGPHYLVDFNTADSDCSVLNNSVAMTSAWALNDTLVSPSASSSRLTILGNTANQSNLLLNAQDSLYTPVFGNFVATYTTQSGRYQVLGNLVSCEIYIETSAVTLPDGSGFRINLPFPAADQAVNATLFFRSGETPMVNSAVQIVGFGIEGNGLAISGPSGDYTFTEILSGAGSFRVAFSYFKS